MAKTYIVSVHIRLVQTKKVHENVFIRVIIIKRLPITIYIGELEHESLEGGAKKTTQSA